MTQGQYVAATYAVVFVFVLVYVAIIAAKLSRLQREVSELLELARRRADSSAASAIPMGESAGERA
ncbi:MAG TPA: CcmD family protein [Gaiellaceae bacterium]|nr:CcmD family protein [Gaiellaceae bacterium]